MTPSRPSVRALLAKVLLSDSDLNAFCIDYFEDVHSRFTAGMDRVGKVNLLLELVATSRIVDALRQAHPAAVQEHEGVLEPEPALVTAIRSRIGVIVLAAVLLSLGAMGAVALLRLNPVPNPVPSGSASIAPPRPSIPSPPVSTPPPAPPPSDTPIKPVLVPAGPRPATGGGASCGDSQCTLTAGSTKPIEGLQGGNRVCVSVTVAGEQVRSTCTISANNENGTQCALDQPVAQGHSSGSWSHGVCK